MIDAHVHVVSHDEQRFPLRPPGFGTDWFRTAAVDIDELRGAMAGAGVDGAVLVQAFGAYSTDNEYVLDAGRTSGLPAVVIAETAAGLRALVDLGAGGVRLFAIGGDRSIEDLSVWSAARELDIPVVVATLPDGLPALSAMLRRFPDTAVALDHCAFVDRVSDLSPLVAFDNLHLKVTPHVLSLFAGLCDLFGPHRLLWGSDFPQLHDRPYGEVTALGRAACRRLDPADQVAFLGGNARRLWPGL